METFSKQRNSFESDTIRAISDKTSFGNYKRTSTASKLTTDEVTFIINN